MLDPLALIQLRTTGSCFFEIPEALFDLDHAGHYFRRLKAVSITLPCIAGPYTSVSAKLSLVSNKYRKNSTIGGGYLENPVAGDERFAYNIGTIQSIATSNAQNDSGMFELNFRDERYLPFEGCGAVSTWRLELPTEAPQFDYATISDILLHLKFTAREGGSMLRGKADLALRTGLNDMKQQLNETGLHHVIDVKHDLSNVWYQLQAASHTATVLIDKDRLPYFVQAMGLQVTSLLFVGKRAAGGNFSFTAKIAGAATATTVNMTPLVGFGELISMLYPVASATLPLAVDFEAANYQDLEELILVVKYSV